MGAVTKAVRLNKGILQGGIVAACCRCLLIKFSGFHMLPCECQNKIHPPTYAKLTTENIKAKQKHKQTEELLEHEKG